MGVRKPIGYEVWDEAQIPIIRYKGTFDWPGVYRLCKMWLEDNRYVNHNELRYKHKGEEVEIDLAGERKIDEMHKFHVSIYFHLWQLKDITVAQGTKTLKMNNGLLQIEIWGGVEVDYQGRFQKTEFTRKLRTWWHHNIGQREYQANYNDRLVFDLYQLQTAIKTFLNMETDINYYK
jgi:hypothetical protein